MIPTPAFTRSVDQYFQNRKQHSPASCVAGPAVERKSHWALLTTHCIFSRKYPQLENSWDVRCIARTWLVAPLCTGVMYWCLCVFVWLGGLCAESVLVTGLGYSYRYTAPSQDRLCHHVKDGCWWCWAEPADCACPRVMSCTDDTMTSLCLYLPPSSLPTTSIPTPTHWTQYYIIIPNRLKFWQTMHYQTNLYQNIYLYNVQT